MKNQSVIKILAAFVIAGFLSYLVYYFFFKEKIKDEIIKISSDELSELINMDVDFEGYTITDGGTTLVITGLVITSPYPMERYKEINEYETDWFNFEFKKVRLVDFDYERLIKDNHFSAAQLIIEGAEIDVYRDKTISEPPFKHKPLIASLLRNIDADLNIDSLSISDFDIRYFEKSEFSDQSGRISFNNLSAKGNNITNNKERLAENATFTLDAQAYLMGEARINAQFIFDLNNEKDHFTVSAEIEPFKAQVLNTMITGVLPAKVTEGRVIGMKIYFEANENIANGTVDFEYEDLQFELFKEEDKPLKSFFSTQGAKLALRKTNTNDGKNYRQGIIEFNRRKDKSIFNYWWFSLKSGIIDTMLSDAGKFLNLDAGTDKPPERED